MIKINALSVELPVDRQELIECLIAYAQKVLELEIQIANLEERIAILTGEKHKGC